MTSLFLLKNLPFFLNFPVFPRTTIPTFHQARPGNNIKNTILNPTQIQQAIGYQLLSFYSLNIFQTYPSSSALIYTFVISCFLMFLLPSALYFSSLSHWH